MLTKIAVIGTEIGFIILGFLYLTMYFLEHSGGRNAYTVRLILSWCGVAVNMLIILLQIIVRVVYFIQERRKKKKAEEQKKRNTNRVIQVQVAQTLVQTPTRGSTRRQIDVDLHDDSQLVHLQKRHPNRYEIGSLRT